MVRGRKKEPRQRSQNRNQNQNQKRITINMGACACFDVLFRRVTSGDQTREDRKDQEAIKKKKPYSCHHRTSTAPNKFIDKTPSAWMDRPRFFHVSLINNIMYPRYHSFQLSEFLLNSMIFIWLVLNFSNLKYHAGVTLRRWDDQWLNSFLSATKNVDWVNE
jgi:hypothetical protein